MTTNKAELTGLFNNSSGYADLRNQIRQFVKELYKNSATIQMRARGSRRHYTIKYAPPASIFAKFCAERESDIDAFDAAYRLLVDADQLTDYAKNDST